MVSVELSRVADYFITVSMPESHDFATKHMTLHNSLRRKQIVESVVVLKASGGPEYFRNAQISKWGDGQYAWNYLLGNVVALPVHLRGGHYDSFTGNFNLSKVAVALRKC